MLIESRVRAGKEACREKIYIKSESSRSTSLVAQLPRSLSEIPDGRSRFSYDCDGARAYITLTIRSIKREKYFSVDARVARYVNRIAQWRILSSSAPARC